MMPLFLSATTWLAAFALRYPILNCYFIEHIAKLTKYYFAC
jgi:hypothetical protein